MPSGSWGSDTGEVKTGQGGRHDDQEPTARTRKPVCAGTGLLDEQWGYVLMAPATDEPSS